MKSLARLIIESSLERLAGERSFQRGVAYFRSGAVERLVSRNERISARVLGTDVYAVKLWPEARGLGWSCTCPVGQDSEFCKHAVAVGLSWIAAGSGHAQAQDPPQIEVVRRFLEASDKPALVEMLMEYVCDDDELIAQLLLAAQRQGIADPGALEQTIRKAFASRDFVDYERMGEVAARARPVPELLEELLKRGDAAAAVKLAAEAMRRGLELLENSDDSDGVLGDILRAVADVHVRAAGRGGLSRADLAKNLFDLQRADGFGFLRWRIT